MQCRGESLKRRESPYYIICCVVAECGGDGAEGQVREQAAPRGGAAGGRLQHDGLPPEGQRGDLPAHHHEHGESTNPLLSALLISAGVRFFYIRPPR